MTRPDVAARRTRRTGQRGQSLVEFAMVVTVMMLLLLGMLEFGFVFDHHLTIEYASREGARTGSALANGGGVVGCGTGQSPNAASVDKQIIAAVQRVLTSPGSPVVPSRVGTIKHLQGHLDRRHQRQLGQHLGLQRRAGPVVDGKALDFVQSGGTGWAACLRNNGTPADSIGVSLTYSYHLVTPLSAVMGFFGGGGPATIPIADKTVMALNPGT